MSILDAISPYKLLIEIVVIGSLAGGEVYGVHLFLQHEQAIGEARVQARWDAQIAKDKEAAQRQTAEWDKQRDKSTTEGVKRDETIRALSTAVVVSTNGLRDAITKNNGSLPGYSADALRDITKTYGELLAGCQGRYHGMGEEVERVNSEKRTLMESWPKARAMESP